MYATAHSEPVMKNVLRKPIVMHVHKNKRQRLDTYAPLYISPINATNISTAVLGRPFYLGQKGLSSSVRRSSTIETWRVLLDSGSDGDILFRNENGKKSVPYVMRDIPQLWHTSHGLFRTEKVGNL